VEAVAAMDETVKLLGNPEFHVTAIVARWHPVRSALAWVNCGHPAPYVVSVDGAVEELPGPDHPALGAAGRSPGFAPAERQLRPGERLILVTDGILDRQVEGGGTFGADGLKRAIAAAETATAAATAMAILQAVTASWREPLEDDGTAVVFAIG
jgi:serine phosphatase RsbU (regulator of sigma subunit)